MVKTRGILGRRGAGVLLVLALCLLAAAAPDDPLAERQYHHNRVRVFDAWDVTRGSGQVIAVLDTGVDLTHPDLRRRLVAGVDLVDRNTPPDDPNGHGTFVAGIAVATADNGKGGAGVAPNAKVMPVTVLDEDGMGTSDVVAEGIRWATREGATVINLSLADVPGQRRSPTALITTDVELAIRQAVLDGVSVVAAAGNEGEDSTPYNRDLPALIVGATTRRDAVWEHSNYDDRTIFAPGVGLISTYVGTSYAAADGTSFAAPIVAAGAALLRADGYDEEDTRRRLIRTARPVEHGVGRVDIAAALGVARRVRSRAKPPADDGDDANTRRPRPVTQPSPVAPTVEPEKSPTPAPQETQSPEPKPRKKRRVAAADPAPTEGLEDPSPLPLPPADGASLAGGPLEVDGQGTPVWPMYLASGLLFGVSVALAGYFTARRSGG